VGQRWKSPCPASTTWGCFGRTRGALTNFSVHSQSLGFLQSRSGSIFSLARIGIGAARWWPWSLPITCCCARFCGPSLSCAGAGLVVGTAGSFFSPTHAMPAGGIWGVPSAAGKFIAGGRPTGAAPLTTRMSRARRRSGSKMPNVAQPALRQIYQHPLYPGHGPSWSMCAWLRVWSRGERSFWRRSWRCFRECWDNTAWAGCAGSIKWWPG